MTIIAQYPNSVGESTSAKQRTSEHEGMNKNAKTNGITLMQLFVSSPHTGSLPGVSSLSLLQAGFFSLSVGWDPPSSPVQGYRLTYGPRGQANEQYAFVFSVFICLLIKTLLYCFVTNMDLIRMNVLG